MNWQQIVMIVLLGLDLGCALANHGKPYTGNHNFWIELITDGIIAWILISAGFWK